MMEPDALYEMVLNRINKREIKLFVITSIIGFIIHFNLYSQQLTNPDGRWMAGAYNYKSTYWETALGRWGLYLFDCSRGFLSSPFLTAAISIVIMSCAGIYLLRVLDIKGIINSIIIMIMMISMPCFSYTLSYWYCSDAYTFAMLMGILAVYFCKKPGKQAFLGGMLCITIMLGLYQAYLGVTVGLCLICMFIYVHEGDSIIELGNKIGRFLLMGLCGIATYWIILQVALIFWDTELSEYSGANNIGILNSLKYLPERLLHTYNVVYEWMFGDEIILNAYWKREYMFILMIVLFAIAFIVMNKKSKIRILLFEIGIILLFPIGICIIEIAAPERDINILLSCGMCLIIPFFLKIIEMSKKNILKWCAVILSLVIVWTYILTDNATYLAVQTTQRQTETVMRDIYSRIQGLEDCNANRKYLFAGIIDEHLYKRDAKIYKMSYGLWSDMNSFWNTYAGAKGDWFFLYFDLLGLKLNMCSEKEYNQVVNSEEFRNMPIYPNDGSVKVIEGIVCVKMSETPPLLEKR